MAKKKSELESETEHECNHPPTDRVELVKAVFAGLKDLLVIVASVATIYFQAMFGAKQDVALARQEVVMAKQDVAAQKAEEVKKALDKME